MTNNNPTHSPQMTQQPTPVSDPRYGQQVDADVASNGLHEQTYAGSQPQGYGYPDPAQHQVGGHGHPYGHQNAPRGYQTPEAQPSTVFGNLTLGGALFVVLWPIVALAGYHFLVAKKSEEVLRAAIKSRPGIVIGNVQRTVQAGVESGLPLNEAINRANGQFQTYAKRGYVVLDANAVLASPPQDPAKPVASKEAE